MKQRNTGSDWIMDALALRLNLNDAYLLAKLDSFDEEATLVKRADEVGITLSSLSHYYLSEHKRPGLVLGYAGSTEAELMKAGTWLNNAYISLQNVLRRV